MVSCIEAVDMLRKFKCIAMKNNNEMLHHNGGPEYCLTEHIITKRKNSSTNIRLLSEGEKAYALER
jgi:hypothetical protein